jgi:hypothetical protein
MGSPFQEQALRRKVVYIGLIVALGTIASLFRIYVVEAKAADLALREQSVGEVELGGSALQLSLTGLRGFVVCYLWYNAQDAQAKNRWNELDLYVRSLTRLQPHFISPWLFQSWNLSYNVSVEADQARDKYFYVFRGVQLLEEGERRNHCQPDMRYSIGFYQQHKVMQSDETNYHRCLYQMSCIPPPERDIDVLMPKDPNTDRRSLDLAAFQKFCVAHPQLVRRLQYKLRCNKPEDVVRFLDENKKIPSIYVDEPDIAGPEWQQGRYPLKPIMDRYPALPPPLEIRQQEVAPATGIYDPNEISYLSPLEDDIDAYVVGRAWYGYAQEALPPPSTTLPGEPGPITDRLRQRKSKMTVNLFRNHPPRAQSNHCERLQDEGWFAPDPAGRNDDEKRSGWLITDWFPRNRFADGSEARVGAGIDWAGTSWDKAHKMWEKRGKDSLMLPDPQELEELRAKARRYLEPNGQDIRFRPQGEEPKPGDPDHEAWVAAQYLWQLDYAFRLTNFKHFYYRAQIEMQPDMIRARRTMFNARQSLRQGQRERAQTYFESATGLPLLRQLVDRYASNFREDSNGQEDVYELQIRYVKLMQDKEGASFKNLMEAGSLLGMALPHGAAPNWPGAIHVALTSPSLTSALPVPEFVPSDRLRVDLPGPDGKPIIEEGTKLQIEMRHGLRRPSTPTMPPEAGGPMPGRGGAGAMPIRGGGGRMGPPAPPPR